MAGIKISALPAAGSSQLTDLIPAVQSGVTVKETLQQVVNLFNSNIQLASTAQVTGLDAALLTFLPLAGGTMAGALILNTSSPTVPLEAASKGYVDTVASGFTVVLACLAATTVNLNTVYANGAAGVGATLTDNVGTFLPFSVDGVSPALGSRILVKDQTTTFQNGIYVLTTNGDSISVPYVLTRATDYDQAPSEIHPGTLVAVNSGTVNSSTSWLETATVTTIGTDPILFSQFTFAPSAFLQVANNLSDVASASTSRTNLGLGTVATKTASDNAETIAVMVSGATVIGNLAVFSDVNGTIEDGGMPASAFFNSLCTGRITLTSGVPVTTSDVTGATTIYFTPYKGNLISLFDGVSTWNTISFSETSIAVPGTTSTMYDLFAYNNAGTMALETQTWTNDTTRAIAIVLQDGVYVKNGATTRRYLGSFRTTTVNGQTEDSKAKRYIYNYFNRTIRDMKAVDATNSWNYSANAYRQANGSTANQLDFIVGVSEDAIYAQVTHAVSNSTASDRTTYIGIGLDSTTVNSALVFNKLVAVNAGNLPAGIATFNNIIAVGRHILTWLEHGAGADTQTWYGTQSGVMQTGIVGSILA